MKKLFFLLLMLCMALSPVFAAKSAIVGTWYILNPDRECVYYKFTEDNKCSKWIEYSHFDTGELTTEQIFTDVPYSFDEENMIITVQEKEDFSWHWELDCIEADRFVVMGDWISYYRVKTFSQENQDGVTIYYSLTSDSECEIIAGKSPYEGEIVIPQTVEYEGAVLSVTSIANNAFFFCDGVTKVVFPESLTSIGNYAFMGCYGIEETILPDGVTTIGESSFECCISLKKVVLPNSITSIDRYAFRSCAIDSIVLPNSLTGIESGVFNGCENLISIVIPEGVTYIGSSAFEGCYKLESVKIPTTVNTIYLWAFWACAALKAVYVGATPPDCSLCDEFPFKGIPSECTLYVPSGASSSYQQAVWWMDFQNIAEYDPSSIKNITLKHGESVYNINGAKMVRDVNNNMFIKDGKKYLNIE